MPKKIMIVRHGEKPDKADSIHGVDAEGEHDKRDLSPRGWQRSGALVRFFNPVSGQFSHAALAKPDAIYAVSPQGGAKSQRAEHTVESVAEFMGLHLNLKHDKGDEKELVKDVMSKDGVVLIAWEHNAILDIANLIFGNDKSTPQKWPDSRYDLVWVLDQQPHPGGWEFTQVPQLLLPGDSAHLL
ncbi:MAG TPA: histidine phosphatase family protein [Candidatus Acidoferrum sp.]|nr:histidine phosphatase family protein [Candidatus Acidoferrum sp.]